LLQVQAVAVAATIASREILAEERVAVMVQINLVELDKQLHPTLMAEAEAEAEAGGPVASAELRTIRAVSLLV
jgi:hypothetical protein